MKMQEMSDAKLLELGLMDEYCARFRHKDFTVYDKDRERYVESIDTYDGDTEWTSNPSHARIFHGEGWAKIWASKQRRFILPGNLP